MAGIASPKAATVAKINDVVRVVTKHLPFLIRADDAARAAPPG
jgi:hypothetical protein